MVAVFGFRLLSLCVLLTFSGQLASAVGVIVNSQSFESFSNAALQGQNGWAAAPNSGATTATVQTSQVLTGSKAVQVTKKANSDRRFAVPNLTGYPTQRYVTIDWDMLVSPPADPEIGFGPFFGIEAYDTDGTFGRLAGFGVDASTRDVLYQTENGDGVLEEAGPKVTLNTWHHYRVVIDFTLDKYIGYVNGAQVVDSGFVNKNLNLNHFSDADITAVAASGGSVSTGLEANAFYDNFLVFDGVLLAGDYDLDGDVDAGDFDRWRSKFGNVVDAAGHYADGNRNGKVDSSDYVIWRKNLGATQPAGAGAALEPGDVQVPEPAAMVLMLGGISGILLMRRRRQRLA